MELREQIRRLGSEGFYSRTATHFLTGERVTAVSNTQAIAQRVDAIATTLRALDELELVDVRDPEAEVATILAGVPGGVQDPATEAVVFFETRPVNPPEARRSGEVTPLGRRR